MRITEETIDKMNVYNLRNFLLDRGITAANYQRADLIVFAKAAPKMKLSTNIDFHEDKLDLSDRFQIKAKYYRILSVLQKQKCLDALNIFHLLASKIYSTF